MKKFCFIFLSFISNFCFAEFIRIVPQEGSPEGESVVLKFELPERGASVGGNFPIQIRVRNYALGTNTLMPRAEEVLNYFPDGQSVRLEVDNKPLVIKTGPSIEPFDEDSDDIESTFRFHLPFSLEPGLHIIRAFLARSFGESLKGDNSYTSTYWYVGGGRGNPTALLEEPTLIYNEPNGRIRWQEGKPVLFDFFLYNVLLSPDGYKVKLVIDNREEFITKWIPFYVYGLKRGVHKIHIELVDSNGELVPGHFTSTDRTFVVE